MRTKNLYGLLAIFVLWSCSDSDDPPSVDSKTEFSVKSSVIDVKVSTRTAYEGVLSTTNPLTALVLTSKNSLEYKATDVVCIGTMTFTSDANVVYNKPVTSGSYLFPSDNAPYFMSALYPATEWNLTAVDGKALRTLTGKEDIMVAIQKQTSEADVRSADYPRLDFTHKLAFLRLMFSGDEAAVADVTTVTDIQLTQVNGAAIPADMEVNLTGNPQKVTFAGAAATLDCYDKGTDTKFATAYSVTETPVKVAYVLVPPTIITAAGVSYEYTFRIDYNAGGENRSLAISLDLSSTSASLVNLSTEGYAFNIKFRFVGEQIQAMATVADWKDGTELDIEL